MKKWFYFQQLVKPCRHCLRETTETVTQRFEDVNNQNSGLTLGHPVL